MKLRSILVSVLLFSAVACVFSAERRDFVRSASANQSIQKADNNTSVLVASDVGGTELPGLKNFNTMPSSFKSAISIPEHRNIMVNRVKLDSFRLAFRKSALVKSDGKISTFKSGSIDMERLSDYGVVQHIDGSEGAMDALGSISGTVYESDGITPINDAEVELKDASLNDITSATTNALGQYSFEDLASGDYYVFTNGWVGGQQLYVSEYYNESTDEAGADPVTVTTPDATTGINFTLENIVNITGVVYQNDGVTPIANAEVVVYKWDWTELVLVCTDALGQYSVSGLRSWPYFVLASGYVNGQGYTYAQEYFEESSVQNDASLVWVSVPDPTTGIDFTLQLAGSISGTVYESDGVTPIEDLLVIVFNTGWQSLGNTLSNSQGQYTLEGIGTGNYYVEASGYVDGQDNLYVCEYYNESPDQAGANQVSVAAPTATTGIDFTLDPSGSIAGTVYESDGVTPIENAPVLILNSNGDLIYGGSTDASGYYEIRGPASGSFYAYASGRNNTYQGEYYNETPDFSSATLVSVTAPSVTPGIDFTLIPPLTHDAGNVVLRIFNNAKLGDYGDENSAYWPKSGGDPYLFDGGLWVGCEVGGEKCVMRYEYNNSDWQRTPGTAHTLAPGVSDQDGQATYDDHFPVHGAGARIGLEVHQTSYQWADTNEDDFIIFEYEVTNLGTNGALDNVYVTFWNDPDVGDAPSNRVGYDSQRDLLYIWNSDNTPAGYYGIQLLGPEAPHTVNTFRNGEDPNTNDECFEGITDATVNVPGSISDYRCLITAPPFSLTANETRTVTFGMVLGSGLAELQANSDEMRAVYEDQLVDEYTEQQTVVTATPLSFNDGGSGDGHEAIVTFTSSTGSGDLTVQQTNTLPSYAPARNACPIHWNFDLDPGVTGFNANLVFHYSDSDIIGYTESDAFLGIAKFNASTNTWTWLGGTVDAGANTITVNGVTSFSEFALFRRIFGDITGDGYVDAADLQRLGDCWHDTNSGEFTGGSDARFFNYNKNTDGGNQIIDAADLQVFGDCWHNGTGP